jgi:hypothetical protein
MFEGVGQPQRAVDVDAGHDSTQVGGFEPIALRCRHAKREPGAARGDKEAVSKLGGRVYVNGAGFIPACREIQALVPARAAQGRQ